jgi:antitoxin StbD
MDQIEEVTQLANLVFGDNSVATSWLREPNLATDNQSPISLLGTVDGFDRVKDLLLRIQYGVLA